jgi:hypothetical protein
LASIFFGLIVDNVNNFLYNVFKKGEVMKEQIAGRVDGEVKKAIEKKANKKKWTFSFALNEILKEYFKKGE